MDDRAILQRVAQIGAILDEGEWVRAWVIYMLAALLEIGGCFAAWRVIKRDAQPLWLLAAAAALAGFAWLLAQSEQPFAGRAFAAYGGVYVAASLGWLWLAEGVAPSRTDMLGGCIVLVGAWVIFSGGRA